MPHHTPLIATIVAGLTVAFLFGALAQRFRISPLVGYLLAGIAVGPFTPGYVADQGLATQLAEIGVILLMFGVGLHFSLKDLLSVRMIAIPGAVAQIAVATLLGMGLAWMMGWPPISGFVFGLALSVASTVVLLRALELRRIVQTDRGRIAVGWLIVEDLAMVLALVLLPALARAAAGGTGDVLDVWIAPLGLTVLKVGAFVAFMLIVGRRIIPWILHWVAHTGSRELFRLAVFAIALGVAFGATMLFDVSFALGAFFAGMILAESELSQRAAEETLPLRDAFAVLFFVSVGMLFNPMVVITTPWPLAATVAIIVIGKSLAAYAIVRLFGHGDETALTVSASLAQIGEFSFILAGLSVGLGLLPAEGRDLILAAAIISIVLNPLVFTGAVALARRRAPPPAPAAPAEPPSDLPVTALSEHTIVVGFGRVGRVVARGLDLTGQPFLVIEYRSDACTQARDEGYEILTGNAADGRVLAAARIERANRLLVTAPDGFEAGQIAEQARRANPGIEIIARAHSEDEAAHLLAHGADEAIMAEHEIATAMMERARARAQEAKDEAREEAAQAAAAESRSKPILDDAEHAVLAAFAALGVGAGEARSRADVCGQAQMVEPFTPTRLDEAVGSLQAKGLVTDLGDERVAPTREGLVLAVRKTSL